MASSSGKSLEIPEDKLTEIRETFQAIDANGNGFLERDEVKQALELCGFKLVPYQINKIMLDYDIENKDGRLDFSEFKRMYRELLKNDFGHSLSSKVTTKEGIKGYGGGSEHANVDIFHSLSLEEQKAFADWINRSLANDKDCAKYLPFSVSGDDLYEKCTDGVILCKVINVSKPDTIDERAINKGKNLNVYQIGENLVLAINSAKSIGIVVEGNSSDNLKKGTKHLVLGLLWQIIKLGLLCNITLQAHKDLVCLLREGETIDDLMKMSPIDLLIRWVNYHLQNAGVNKRINNFSNDIHDSEAYAYLIQQITPDDKRRGMHSAQSILSNGDKTDRAEHVLQNASRLDARVFVTPQDIVSGNAKLNLAFVANLFNNYPALEKREVLDEEIIEETREEKTFKNWMNSLNVDPHVNNLYYDLRDGIIIFQLYDIIRNKIVNWKRVHTIFSKLKMNFEILENCNYALELGKACHFVLVGIGGEDLRDGNRLLTLGLVWQLMRAYTSSLISQCASINAGEHRDASAAVSDHTILAWAQEKLKSANKNSKINGFQDPTLKDGLAMADLVDAVVPNSIKYDILKRPPSNEEERLANAKYAISVARRSGAMVYALPEDIAEVKAKMVLTMVASLMVLDHHIRAGSIVGPAGETKVF